MTLRILVIEPSALRRRLLCETIAESNLLDLTGAFATPADALQSLAFVAGSARPDNTLDLHGNGNDRAHTALGDTAAVDLFIVNATLVGSQYDALQRLRRQAPEAGFVVVDVIPNLGALLAAKGLPLRGFLTFSHIDASNFVSSLLAIAYGGAVIEPMTARLLLEHLAAPPSRPDAASLETLTAREEEVMSFVGRGLSNKEIARDLGVSLGTVRAHLRSVFRKLGVGSRTGAAGVYHNGATTPPRP